MPNPKFSAVTQKGELTINSKNIMKFHGGLPLTGSVKTLGAKHSDLPVEEIFL